MLLSLNECAIPVSYVLLSGGKLLNLVKTDTGNQIAAVCVALSRSISGVLITEIDELWKKYDADNSA